MKTLSLFLSLHFSFALLAQSAQIDVNSINATVENTGTLFNQQSISNPGFETENGSGIHTIYSTSLWMGGNDLNQGFHGAFGSFGEDTDSYTTGPLTITPGTGTTTNEEYGPAQLSPSAQQSFSGIYCVTSTEVAEFVQFFSCNSDPSCNTSVTFPNYSIPNSIINWPAHGDISNDQAFNMAPFVDVDGDGFYNPNVGDYPCIKGDKYAWMVINDRNPNSTQGSSIGVEIHVEVYAFDRVASNPLNQTVFVGYDIINRSTQTLNDFYIGAFTDLDIGCSDNDFIGSIPELNSLFGYNSTTVDNSCMGNNGFGATPPAQGMIFLNTSISNSISFSSGLASYNSFPTNPVEHYNYLLGKFRDGSDLFYGGDGHSSSSGVTTTPTSFQYPQTPPMGSANWTEVTQANIGGNRYTLGSTGPYIFTPGMIIELDLAFVYARANAGDHLASIPLLETSISMIQNFYDDSITGCYLPSFSPLSIQNNTFNLFQVSPNPSKGIIHVNIETTSNVNFEVIDMFGEIVQSNVMNHSKSIDITNITAGVYLINLYDENHRLLGNAKVLKE